VQTLRNQVLRELREGRQPEIWAHSQGGAVASLALYEADSARKIAAGTPNPLAGVKVKSFGSAAPAWVDGPDYEHFIHVNDPVPSMFGLGHSAVAGDIAAGKAAKIIRFSGDPESELPYTTSPSSKALDLIPLAKKYHPVGSSYLKMEKQQNGGCP
jgi:hypothetical protein